MNWTDETREEIRRLHALGMTDKEIADCMGTVRNVIANYRHHVLRLPVNPPQVRACPECGALRQNMELHNLKTHKRNPAPRTPGGHYRRRLKRVPAIAVLNPRNGNFNSAAALAFLVDHWRKGRAA